MFVKKIPNLEVPCKPKEYSRIRLIPTRNTKLFWQKNCVSAALITIDGEVIGIVRLIWRNVPKRCLQQHSSNQKTGLNDAQALAFLAREQQLWLVKLKDRQQLEFASLTTLREQCVKQYR